MERSRFVTIALIVLSVITALHARHLVELSAIQLLILITTACAVHICALVCTGKKYVHAVSPLVSFVLLTFILLVINAKGDFMSMIPSPSSLIDVYDSIRQGVKDIKTNDSPFEATPSVFLVCIVLMWSISEVGETLAQRLHSSAPTLLWFIFLNAGIAAQEGTGFLLGSVLLLCAGSWFFLYAFDRSHERSRSHLIEIPSSARISSVAGYILSFVALAGLSLLLALPATNLPSLAPKNLFEFLNSTPNQTELSPLVSMKQMLNTPQQETLFTATASEAQYFRVAVLDDFDGTTWSTNSRTEAEPERIPAGVQTRRLNSTIQLRSLTRKFLPTFYSTNDVSIDNITFLQHSVIYAKDNDISTYSISATAPTQTLTDEQIARSSEEAPSSVESSMLLPTDFDQNIIDKARSIAENRQSIYEQALALRDFFLDGSFTYDLQVDFSSSTNAMTTFLEERRGFCEQFAATYAAMARSVGIPARVIVGFTPGQPDINGQFTIQSHQAHSWVEVYLSNFGWLTIDPTPAGPLPGQAPTNIGAVVATTTTTTTTTIPGSTTASPAITTTVPVEVEKAQKSQGSGVTPFVVLLFGLVFSGIAFVVARKRYWAQEKNVEQYVLESFHEISEKVLDIEPQPSLTIRELQQRVPTNNISINEFLELFESAAYAPNSPISLSTLREAAAKARSERILIKR